MPPELPSLQKHFGWGADAQQMASRSLSTRVPPAQTQQMQMDVGIASCSQLHFSLVESFIITIIIIITIIAKDGEVNQTSSCTRICINVRFRGSTVPESRNTISSPEYWAHKVLFPAASLRSFTGVSAQCLLRGTVSLHPVALSIILCCLEIHSEATETFIPDIEASASYL